MPRFPGYYANISRILRLVCGNSAAAGPSIFAKAVLGADASPDRLIV
jgi:hypothetical protein